jgi:hypothetical protein
VTVRERSVLTITETANTATIDITAGRIALAVAKDRMRPGQSLDVKAPNAIAGVRGTVLIGGARWRGCAFEICTESGGCGEYR